MSDTPADVDPDRVVTDGELAAVIVVSVLIFILLVIQIALLIYIFCRKKRCPCSRKKSEADSKPYYENRYGEISWSYAEKKVHRDSKRSDEESLIGEEASVSEDSGSRVVGIDDEHTKKQTPRLKHEDPDKQKKEEVEDVGEDELVPDDEAKKEGDEGNEDDEAKKQGDEGNEDDEAKKKDDEGKKEDDERDPSVITRLDEDEDEHTKNQPAPLKHEDLDDKQKKEEVKDVGEDDLDPDDKRKMKDDERDPSVISKPVDENEDEDTVEPPPPLKHEELDEKQKEEVKDVEKKMIWNRIRG
ncbi:glutamic acid-rich protein-like [Haliotis rubra]|uniref:glutamic acid-rich protein-like n=1 Tax=Haliotis rubra TaxID=36100 RepID=UPI001EE5ED7B|nr:glutamic acid-rich protein-like [Haliotis rubra]